MRAWRELTAIALEGTAKTAGDGDAQRRLLSEAAWHTLTRLAGRKTETFTAATATEAPGEELPLVSRAAATRLEEILRSEDREHLGEWLQLAAHTRKRVPPSLLPPLLERGEEKSDLRADILATGGARVGWLAGQNEEWAYAAIADPQEAFKTGIRSARVAALAVLRRQDPVAALATLADGWSREGGDNRAALISVLAVGLGTADEPFLTEATTDGREEVRATAADLLARLPTSALIGRMVARADSWINFKKGMLGAKFEVTPPTDCTPDMVADGIDPKPPNGIGERAHWLRQVVALVPPARWSQEIFDPGIRSYWQEPLLVGWTEATVRFRDAAWCELLIEHYLGVKERYKIQGRLQSLVQATPKPTLEALIERHLRKDPRSALELASRSTERCGPQISVALVRGLEQVVPRRQAQQDYGLAGIARNLRQQLDPAVLPDVIAAADRAVHAEAELASEAFQGLAAALEYRAEMAKEIAT